MTIFDNEIPEPEDPKKETGKSNTPKPPEIIDAVIDQEAWHWIRFGTELRAVWFSLAELQNDEKAVFGRLAGPGMTFLTAATKNKFKKTIEAHEDYRPGLVAARPGWAGPHYVFGDGRVQRSTSDDREVIVTFDPHPKFSPRGTLLDWTREIGPIVSRQPIPLFALAYGFVGPLLRFAPPYLLNPQIELVGEPESGKSTMGMLAASIWAGDPTSEAGGGERWDLTINALDRVKTAHSDSLFVLDEGNLAGTNTHDQQEVVRKAIFKTASKGGRKRYTDTSRLPNVNVALFSTSNERLGDLVRATGAVAGALQSRMATIHLRKDRPHGVLDFVPDGFENSGLAIQRLREIVDAHYGVAARHFMIRLVEAATEEAKLRSSIEELMAKFLHRLCGRRDGGSARVSHMFALTYAAGRLARRWGVLPKEWGPLQPALLSVWDMVDASPALQPRPAAIDRVRQYARQNRSALVRVGKLATPLSAREFRRASGFIRKVGGRTEILIPSPRFQRDFPDSKPLMQELKEAGLARTESGTRPKLTIKAPRRVCATGRVYCILLH